MDWGTKMAKAAFEEWALSMNLDIKTSETEGPNFYLAWDTALAWQAWQAAMEWDPHA